MAPTPTSLRFFTRPAEVDPLAWDWVRQQLEQADTYWVVANSPEGPPHPRPVWGVWLDEHLELSLGSPVVRRHAEADPRVAVHLDSGLDVVLLEGRATGPSEDAAAVAAYDDKYDWTYDLDQYGPLTRIEPDAVLAWRSEGPAGRKGWQEGGRWTF